MGFPTRTLQGRGVPIEGERGVGYVLQKSYFLPPLALTNEEMEALIWGTRLVETFGDGDLVKAARELQIKIASVSPEDRNDVSSALSAFPSQLARSARAFLGPIRNAARKRQKLAIGYRDLSGRETDRIVRPLGLEFWGQVWTLTAWCETRGGFRVFRCDQPTSCGILDDRFREERGKRFADFLARMEVGKPHAGRD